MSLETAHHREAAVDQKTRAEAIRRSCLDFPADFPNREAARHFLNQIILPVSRRWAFISTGKNGSTSTLRVLFEAEFGAPLTASYASERDINPSAIVHQLAEKGVFSRALNLGLSARDIAERDDGMLKICVVRDPHARAASAFRYLCRSDAERSPWFLAERLRLNAFGFDWRTMPGTAEGYRLFLRHLEQEIAALGPARVNGHWRPQVDFIHPDVFRPGLVGRLEDMTRFFQELHDRLGAPAPGADQMRENPTDGAAEALRDDPEARRLVELIYRADFETLATELGAAPRPAPPRRLHSPPA